MGPPLQGQKLRFGRGPPLQGQQPRFGPGPPLQGQQPRFGQGPSLQWDFVRRVVPRPAPTRGRGTSMYRSDEIPLQRRPSQSWCSSLRRACRAGIDEATDTHLAKDAMVRGSGASRPWMACARLLAPWTAQSGDAHDPRTAAAPPEAKGFRRFSSWADPASSDWAKNQEKTPTVAGWGFNWWRWAESNRRPKALHLRYYMLSSPLGLVPWQHGVRSAPRDQPVLG